MARFALDAHWFALHGKQLLASSNGFSPKKLMTNRCNRLKNGVCLIALISCIGCASVPTVAPAPAPPTSAAAGATTIVAVAAPASPGMSLPQFLGLDLVFGGFRRVGQRIRNRLGTRFPGLESKPPILSLTDPANLGPDASPAEKAAAEAKMEDDKAPQKAKAIRYLASRGCGECYPDTEAALLAAMDDCSEAIRFEAVSGLRGVSGDACKCCRENSCCSPKLLKKLYEIAYERNDSGCFLESSARVRRNARLVICACGGAPSIDSEAVPIEGPTSSDALAAPTAAVATVQTAAANQTALKDSSFNAADATFNSVSVVGHTRDSGGGDQAATQTVGFLLPDGFEPTLRSDNVSVRRE